MTYIIFAVKWVVNGLIMPVLLMALICNEQREEVLQCSYLFSLSLSPPPPPNHTHSISSLHLKLNPEK
jgi:hypothetical protein